jgi:hypothetical protein
MSQSTVGAYLSNYDEALKNFYLEPAKEQLNNDNVLMSILSSRANETDVAGTNAKIDCHYGRTTGTGARQDREDLPTAGYQKYKQATVPMKYNYGRVQFTGPTIAATRMDKGAFVRVIDSEVSGMVNDLQRECQRQMWGCGYGILARWRSTVGATSYTLQKKYRSNSAGGDGFGSTFGAKYLDEMGHAVPVVLAASTSAIVSATVATTNIAVSAVAESAEYDTITCTNPSVSEAAGTFYVRPLAMVTYDASNNTGGARVEMMGLRGIVTNEDIDEIALTDGGTNTSPHVDPLQGLDADTYSWWQSYVDAHSSGRYAGQRALTFDLMQKVFDKVEIKAGKDYGPDLIITTHAIRREYLNIVRADRREVNTMQLDGGFTALDYNGIPLTVDRDAIDGEMYFLTTKDLELFRMSDFEWMQKDGAVLNRVTDKDAYEATMFRYAEMGCRRRNSHGVLCDLSYTAT